MTHQERQVKALIARYIRLGLSRPEAERLARYNQ
jgi:hypothetical protein